MHTQTHTCKGEKDNDGGGVRESEREGEKTENVRTETEKKD